MKQQIIDIHCHIYPEKIAAKAVKHVGDFYGLSMEFRGDVETLLEEGQSAGVTGFVVSSVATTPHQVQAINRYLAETAAEYPRLLYALGALHPYSQDQAADVRSIISLGLLGVKMHPDIQGIPIDDPGYIRVFEACSGVLPVLCHLGDKRFDFSNPNRVKKVLERFPDLCLIGAHFAGWSLWEEAYKTLAQYKNLMVDCSSALFAMTPEAARGVIRSFGAERVLFGTDYPMWNAETELKRFHALGLTKQEEELILHENAERIFGLNPGPGKAS